MALVNKLFVCDSQRYIFSTNFCVSLALDLYFNLLPNSPTWLSQKHFKLHIAKVELIKFPLKFSLLAFPFAPTAQTSEVKMSLSASLPSPFSSFPFDRIELASLENKGLKN